MPPLPPLSPRPRKEPVDAVVAFGSNLGDRDATIQAAAARISRLPLVNDVRLSEAIESVAITPSGPDPDAPAYVNAVAIVRTSLAPQVLLGMLHAVEAEFGRERREHWGDRTLDLDLIAYADEVRDDESLRLPHPRAHERLFVLEPWASLDADATLLGHGRIDALIRTLRAGTP